MIKTGILGASGYTGARLAYYLSLHPEIDLIFATSRQEKGKKISDLYGNLKGICDIEFSDPDDVMNLDMDLVFTCAPDQVSMKIAPYFIEKGIAVIDLAGDFRMKSGEDYEKWYNKPHASPEYISKAVYGLTELYRDEIKKSRFISNPGCYPTSVILALAPLLKSNLIVRNHIVVSSVSGISGAGRDMKLYKLFYEADSNVLPYSQGRSHKHVGEIEQELSRVAGEQCNVVFSPHVVPMKTGIVSTITVQLKNDAGKDAIDSAYRAAYCNEYFVRYRGMNLPESKFVADTNFCDIGFSMVKDMDVAVIVSTICNLGKGASGQAVQNMNVMFGFDEKAGLL
jgi:N-acetyl-gamma-glutamyl-phosphate reductase